MSDSDWQDDDEWSDDAPKPDKYGSVETGIMHGINGAVGGFLDEASGAGEAAGRALGIKGMGGSFADVGLAEDGPTLDWETLRDAYKNARDKKRSVLAEQKLEHPGVAGTANVAGMVVSPINKVAKGMTLAKGGAVLGGINALGESEAEDLTGMATDTAIGVGLGGALGKTIDVGAPLLQKGIDKVSSGAADLADRFAARALGAERGTIKSIGIDKVKAAGRQALDEGVLSPLAATDDLVARNTALKNKGGEMMGKAYDAIDDAGASTFNPREVAEVVDDKLGGFWRSPLNRAEASQFDNTIASILERGPGDIPLREAQALKAELQAAANWKNTLNPTAKEQMARDAYKIVSEQIDEAVKLGQGAVDQAGLAETLTQGKQIFSKGATAERLLENKVAREQGNSIIGLTDSILGAGALGYGGYTGDWQTAGGVMLAKKGLQKYGAQNAAIGLDKISKALMKSPQMAQLAQNSPRVFSAIVQKMEGAMGGASKAADVETKPHDPQALIQKAQGTRYAQILTDAEKRGGAAVGATHYILQSDPEYRKAMLADEENQGE